MKNDYSNLDRNTALSLKPSKSIRLLLMVFFVCLFGSTINAATYYSIASGNWNSNTTWSLTSGGVAVGTGVFPIAGDIVIITTGKTVTVTADAAANSISVSGILTINDGIRLTVYNDFIVNLGGSFDMLDENGAADIATLIVYGNYSNNGSTNFWKGNAIIVGDLLSATTSTIQNNGNVVVGGNIIGLFDTTGGTGTGQIYALDPNATVSITPVSIDTNVNPGTFPTGESPTLISLVNTIIYGGDCSFTINNIANVSACSGDTKTFAVVTSGSSPLYQWQLNTGSGWYDIINSLTYSGVATSTLTISGVIITMSNYKYRAKIKSGSPTSCTKNGNYGVLTVNALPVISTQPLSQLDCEGSIVSFVVVAAGVGPFTYIWQRKRPGETIFTTIPTEANGTYPNEIRLQNVGSALAPNGTQYQVLVSNGLCSITSNPATLSVNEITDLKSPSLTPSQSVVDVKLCYGTSYSFTVTTSNPSNGTVSYQWKSSVVSGTWTDVLDGTRFSGAKTATLNVINGTPAESANYRVYVTFNRTGGTCSVDSRTRDRKLTFLPQVQASIISQSQSICINTAPVVLIAPAATGGSGTTYSYQWQTSADNSAWTNVGTNVLNYQPPTLSTSTYYRIIVSDTGTNACGTATSSVVLITVNIPPTAPLIGVISQPDCVLSTGSVVLSGLPAGTWTIFEDGINKGTGTGNTTSVSGIIAGNHTYTVLSGICTSVASASVPIIAPLTATWNGSVWTNGPPISTQALIFSGNYNSVGDLEACSCQVNAGAVVIFKGGHTLKVSNQLIVSGSLTFEDKSSLVQTNDNALNSGNIKYQRKTPNVRSSDYTYWSSPVAEQYLNIFPNSASGRFYSFNASGTPANWQYETPASKMGIGTGYIVQVPLAAVATTYETTFDGVTNNGVITTASGPTDSFNLVGNPYPSAISADAFIDKNINSLNGTLYFWTHSTAIAIGTPNPGSGVYAYSQNDYASYNKLGAISTAKASIILPLNSSTISSMTPNGFIAAGQSFFVSSKIPGIITFNNEMRLAVNKAILDNSQFFKSNITTKAVQTIEKNRIWLNLTNTQGAFKQILVGYATGATNGYDSSYDGQSFNANAYINFYSINLSRNWSIQGRALPFVSSDLIPLGYSSNIAGDFTINIDQLDGVFTNNQVFLTDKLTNTIFDLKSGDYNFTTAIGVFNDRFILCYTNKKTDKTLGSARFSVPENQVLVSTTNTQIQINSAIEIIEKVAIYNLLGKLIFQKNKANTNELIIGNLVSSHQPLVLKIILKKGETLTRKIIY
jgi:hypothetical protein